MKRIKSNLHPRNKHRGGYDFKKLIKVSPELAQFVKANGYGNDSIDFFNPTAVKALNKALLKSDYGIEYWDIPPQYLCPPIPGRVDYIHSVRDLIQETNKGVLPNGNQLHCIDIGVGASCIYPILGVVENDWSFIGSDIDSKSLQSAQQIIDLNKNLRNKIELRLQRDRNNILEGIIQKADKIDVVLCNPPFHSSEQEARSAAHQKVNNLKKKRIKNPILNFGGQQNELWCEGGEYTFVKRMIEESKKKSTQCFWFTSLISKKNNLRHMEEALKKVGTEEVKIFEMSQGNKSSRIICWTFLSQFQQQEWRKKRWRD